MVIRTSIAVWVAAMATESLISDFIPSQFSFLVLFFPLHMFLGGKERVWLFPTVIQYFVVTQGSYCSQLPRVNLITVKFNYFYQGYFTGYRRSLGGPYSAGHCVLLRVSLLIIELRFYPQNAVSRAATMQHVTALWETNNGGITAVHLGPSTCYCASILCSHWHLKWACFAIDNRLVAGLQARSLMKAI